MATLIEILLWIAIFQSVGTAEIGGFAKENYLSYALWAAFISRISSNWMYEYRMIEEIELGTINNIITRPVSFFEYYLSQFMGYKLVTTVISLVFPLCAIAIFELPFHLTRLPLALLLVIYYLVMVHALSFCVANLAFRFNKVFSFTVAKNLGLWLLSGELFPLDLLPEYWKNLLLNLPFSNAVYIPVGYLTGRIDSSLVFHGFLTTTAGILLFGFIGRLLWVSGLRTYSGTGA